MYVCFSAPKACLRFPTNDLRCFEDSPFFSFYVLDSIRRTGLPPGCVGDDLSTCQYCFLNVQCRHCRAKKKPPHVVSGVGLDESMKMLTACEDCMEKVICCEKVDPVTKQPEWGQFEFRQGCHKKVRAQFYCAGANAACKGQMVNVEVNHRFRVRYSSSGFVPALWSSVRDPLKLEMSR